MSERQNEESYINKTGNTDNTMKIIMTKHARERMISRGISLEEVKNAILKGSKRVQDGKIVATYRYFEVVYKKVNEIFVVVTVSPRW
ncbi:MAG: hypothetical protein COT21_02725 [Hadesarchaea archaeon CG08_land_8_20_14_0_20_51_8]|jgi:hypothetical protein|nr:MAG: hypothetical protein COT21_02725 [Hadesarchaea archaeon CG08_land_8_20_14_0_20_51_8]